MEKYFYVMRTHSHTDHQQLWKVMSRQIKDEVTARQFMEFCEQEDTNPKHSYFLIEKMEKGDY